MKQNIFRGVALLVVVLIFAISSISFEGTRISGVSYKSIIYHIGIFSILSFFTFLGWGKNTKQNFLLGIILLIYAISDEVHQIFVRGRFFSIGDIFYDLLGILIGFFLSKIFIKKVK